MKPITGKASLSVLLGAAFLMATSSIWARIYVTNGGVYRPVTGGFCVRHCGVRYFLHHCTAQCVDHHRAYPKCGAKTLRIRYCQGLVTS